MTALTTADATVGGIIIGAVLTLAGVGIMSVVRGGIYDWWQTRKAERIMGLSRPVERMVQQNLAAAPFVEHHHWSEQAEDRDALAESVGLVDARLLDADRVAHERLALVAPVVPLQGRPGRWS